jgi:hypothetical protein
MFSRKAFVAVAASTVCALMIGTQSARVAGKNGEQKTEPPSHELKLITLNTLAYSVKPHEVDRRTETIVAKETMHIVAFEHFTGVALGGWSDNGHILSLDPANPWEKWAEGGTGMEPTGIEGYFGYCGRDYYSEVSGIPDVTVYEALPGGTHILVPKGAKLYLHTYANNFTDQPRGFHHAVRVLYW